MRKHSVTADLHFGHKVVAKIRGFDDVVEHDAFIVERFNKVLPKDGTLWVLGDAAMSIRLLEPLKQLRGRKILVAGNHDHVWHRRSKPKYVRRALKRIPQYLEYFDEVYSSGSVVKKIYGEKVVLSHLPVKMEFKGDRFKERRPLPGSLPVLSGHVHSHWRTDGRQLNVGVDVNDFLPLRMVSAVNEASKLTGHGGAELQLLKGEWNQFGLG